MSNIECSVHLMCQKLFWNTRKFQILFTFNLKITCRNYIAVKNMNDVANGSSLIFQHFQSPFIKSFMHINFVDRLFVKYWLKLCSFHRASTLSGSSNQTEKDQKWLFIFRSSSLLCLLNVCRRCYIWKLERISWLKLELSQRKKNFFVSHFSSFFCVVKYHAAQSCTSPTITVKYIQ